METKKRIRPTIDYIKQMILEYNPETKLLSTEYVNNRTNLDFVCGCGQNFSKTWEHLSSTKNFCCGRCGRKKGWRENRRDANFQEKMEKIFRENGFSPLEPVLTAKQKILCVDTEGYKGRISTQNILLGKHFRQFSVHYNEENFVANLNQFAVLNNIKTQVLSYDKDSGTKRGAHSYLILCQCECGELFQTTVACFLRDKKWRCDVCSKSKSTIEYAVEQEIKKYTRDYISQYHTKNCINPATGYYLYFDFFVPSINCILEVDGEQHFEPRNLNGVTEEKAIDIFKYTKNHDNIKNKYCDDFGIKICRISYKQVNDLSYKQIICSLFNKT